MNSNEYLAQVEAQQAQVDQELRQRPLGRKSPPQPAGTPAPPGMPHPKRKERSASDEEEEAPTALAANYRITGWFWQTVVVPPNMHVVHTRRGHAEPLHVGLGLSFSYNPRTDAFLVIPAAVQTLIINARCISAERQGILVQAYVQWIVDDVRTAYRRLDFSDPTDPMRIVNVQLREQAEAAIKDKVATMPIDAILSDKQPIIEELTLRLRTVAEGSREEGSSGLGLKIVTVQIKEAVVSSTRLWENLQKPFRAERERMARLAELDAQQQIAARELVARQAGETEELAVQRRLAQLRAEQEREVYDRQQAEKTRRHQLEQEAEQRAVAERTATEKASKEAELELALHRLKLEQERIGRELEAVQRQAELERAKAELERQRAQQREAVADVGHAAASAREERDVELFRRRRDVENQLSDEHLRALLVERLPEIAAALPKPNEVRTVSVGGDGTAQPLVGFLASVLELARGLTRPANGKE
jgi:hypothetical protein